MISHNRNTFRQQLPILLTLTGVILAGLPSCTNTSDESQADDICLTRFKAAIEDGTQTKTWLSAETAAPTRKICWIPGDSIALSTDSGTIHAIKAECSDTTSEQVEFLKDIPDASQYVAFYPYRSSISFDGNSYHFSLPSVQRFCSGSFATRCFPMLAHSTTKTLLFKHVCGVLQFSLTGDFEHVTLITFTGRDSLGTALPVAGLATVSMSEEQLPVLQLENSNDTVLTLDCSTQGIELTSTPTTFYMVLPPAKYSTFTITITTHTGKVMTKEGIKPLTIQRGRGTATAAIDFKGDDPIITIADKHFKTYLTKNFDLNGDGEIQRSEARQIVSIKVCTDSISSLSGIGQMPNLHYLKCNGTVSGSTSNGQLTTLDVTALKELQTLICSGNKLTKLPLDGMTGLSWLNCSNNYIDSLNLKSMTGLTYFYCSGNKFTDLDLTASTGLSICYADSNLLDNIYLHHQPETELSCTNAGNPVWVKLGTDSQGEYGYYKPAIYINGVITNKKYK